MGIEAPAAAPALAEARASLLDPLAEALIEETRARTRSRAASRNTVASAAVGGTFLVIAIAFALLAPAGHQLSPKLVAFVVAYALVSRVEFEIGRGAGIPTQLVLVPMLFAVPLNLAPLAVAGALAIRSPRDLPRARTDLNRLFLPLVSSWHALGPAVVLALGRGFEPRWSDWPLYLAALLAQFTLDFASAALRERLAFGASLRAQWQFMKWVYAVDLALAPIGLVFALAAISQAWVPLLLLPLVAILAVFARERTARIDHALELSGAYRGTAFLLGDVVEADDAYTGSHSRDVVSLTLAVVDRLGLPASARRDAEFAALLHDVGKIRIPTQIINKPGPLTQDEGAIIETHTLEGERLLTRVGGLLGDIGHIVRSCHERWDGAGYPDGLTGDSIPLLARIVCCCDAFNAMTTDRPYRRALSLQAAVDELHAQSGKQFDPDVVEALTEVISGSGE